MSEIVDIHPHVISPDTKRYPLSPLGGKQSTWSQAHPVSHETLIAEMDDAGVAKAAVVQASTAYGHNNTYLAEAVAAHPERLTGIFSVDVLADDAVDKIRFWQSKGLTGLRLFTAGSTIEGQAEWLNDLRSNPSWAYASEVGLPICVQMRPQGIPKLRDLLDRFPKAIVVIDHLARPVLDDGPPYEKAAELWALADYPHVHLKLTLRNMEAADKGASTVPAFLSRLLSTFGSERVAWGSNYPAASHSLAELVARIREALADLSEHDRNNILNKTAKRLYPALADAAETI